MSKQVPPYVEWPQLSVDAWGLSTLAGREAQRRDLQFWQKVYRVAAEHAVDNDAAGSILAYTKRVNQLITAVNRPTGPVSDRTRSRRWRAGTRRTKRHARR